MLTKFCKGYLARRKCLKIKLHKQTNNLYSYYWKIDQIQRGHFQRMVRRAWLAYKERKAEKKRKKKEAADKKKKRFGGFRKPTKTGSGAVSPIKNLKSTIQASLVKKVSKK